MDTTQYPETLPDAEKILWTFPECAHTESPLKLTTTFLHRHYSIEMHTHNYFEVNFVLNGKGVHYTESGKRLVSVGDVFVIRPFDKHGYLEIEDLDVFHMCVHKNFINKYYSDLYLLPGFPLLFGMEPHLRKSAPAYPKFCVQGENFDIIARLFDRLRKIDSMHNTANYLNTYGLSLMLLSTLCDLYYTQFSVSVTVPAAGREEKNNYQSVFLALDYIHRHYSEKISLSDLLKVSLLSKNALYREFEKFVHKTPHEYIDHYRILQAKKLLTETDKSVTEISFLVGYCDESYFTKIYKKTEGLSPSNYRRAIMSEDI